MGQGEQQSGIVSYTMFIEKFGKIREIKFPFISFLELNF
jgi:hypothetical protein